MAIQTINIGTVANDGTGDPLRTAFSKSNSNFTDLDTRVNGKQPVDSDLTAIAALTTTPFGRSLLTQADAAASLTTLGAQPVDTDLTAIAALTTTPFGRSLLTQADAATMRATLGAAASNAQSNRNYIINGGFQINQRAVSGTVTLSAGVYGHDRWKAGASGCTYTFATSGGVTTITISAGSLQQVIEGASLETDTYTLSWGGTSQGKIGAGSYGASGISASVTGGSNLTVEFNSGTLSHVQLERGSQATDFERKSIGQTLHDCQRYYYCTPNTSARSYSLEGHFQGANNPIFSVVLPQDMRAVPTFSYTGSWEWNVNGTPSPISSLSLNTVSRSVVGIYGTTTGGSGGQGTSVRNAASDSQLIFAAEL